MFLPLTYNRKVHAFILATIIQISAAQSHERLSVIPSIYVASVYILHTLERNTEVTFNDVYSLLSYSLHVMFVKSVTNGEVPKNNKSK